MNDRLWFLLMVVLILGAYRQFCVVKFYFARRRARRERMRGLRLVIKR